MRKQIAAKPGFTLVEIMIVVAIIGLLAAIAVPNFLRARERSQTNACISNMKQIEGASVQWAMENHKKTGDAITWPDDLVPNYIKTKPQCPSATLDYVLGAVGTMPAVTCPNVAAQPLHVLP